MEKIPHFFHITVGMYWYSLWAMDDFGYPFEIKRAACNGFYELNCYFS